MLRCPDCLDDHEDDALVCGSCGRVLREVDSAGLGLQSEDHETAPRLARLGTFHPAVGERIGELLERRAIRHTVVGRDDGIEVRIDEVWRDDVRSELTLNWDDVLGALDPAVAVEVRAGGGRAPGWYDAPQGGHVDRAGRLVVDAVEDDEDETRVIGPALLACGTILALFGWFVSDSDAALTAGVALAILGLLTPR